MSKAAPSICGVSEPAYVVSDHTMLGGQKRELVVPHSPVQRKSVDKNQWCAGTSDFVIDLCFVDFGITGLKIWEGGSYS